MNSWIEGYKQFKAEMTVNDIHINDLVNDTKSEKVLKYTGGVIEKNFDGIYTYDTIEKLPKEQLPEIFRDIYLNSERFVYLGISTNDGVEPIGWWKTMIEKYAPRKVYTHIKTYGNCNSYEILCEDQYLEWYINNI